MKLISWKSGWKTYAVVLAGVVLGAIQGLDANGMANIHVPSWIDWILGFLGAGTLRHGIQTQTATVIENVLGALTAPGSVQGAAPAAPALTAADIANAVATGMAAQRKADRGAEDKTQAAITAADAAAPTTKAALLADLAAGGPK